jgi:hypothetical protein
LRKTDLDRIVTIGIIVLIFYLLLWEASFGGFTLDSLFNFLLIGGLSLFLVYYHKPELVRKWFRRRRSGK